MDINVELDDPKYHEQKLLFMGNKEVPEADRNLIQRAISQTFQSTTHLVNLLPTGTVLAFQLLSPIFTNLSNCDTVSKFMTTALVAVSGASCFLLSIAIFRGLWVIDGSTTLPSQLAAKYHMRFIDFMHTNVVNCFFPEPSNETREIIKALPVHLGVFSSMLFVAFPTPRHGIGFPLSTN